MSLEKELEPLRKIEVTPCRKIKMMNETDASLFKKLTGHKLGNSHRIRKTHNLFGQGNSKDTIL